MFLQYLDAFIALVFLYVILSVIVTALVENMAVWLRLRGRLLADQIFRMLAEHGDDPSSENSQELQERCLALEFYDHQAIRSLDVRPCSPRTARWIGARLKMDARKGCRSRKLYPLPAEIQPEVFARVVFDIVSQQPNFSVYAAEDAQGVTVQPTGVYIHPAIALRLKQVMDVNSGSSNANFSSTSLEGALAGLTVWYRESMKRMTGHYKRMILFPTFMCAALVCLVFFVDSLAVIRFLTAPGNAAVAKALADRAECAQGQATLSYQKDFNEMQALGLPIGWQIDGVDLPAKVAQIKNQLLSHWIGLLLTACALSFGAPFWYDMLRKLLNARKALGGKDEAEPQDLVEKAAIIPLARPKAAANDSPPDVQFDLEILEQQDLGGGASFNRKVAYVCGFLAQLVYIKQTAVVEAELAKKAGPIEALTCRFFGEWGKVDAPLQNTQVVLLSLSQTDVLVFRGTESIADWSTNAEFTHAPLPLGQTMTHAEARTVHRGFLTAWNLVRSDVLQALEGSTRPLLITGHSLGGALANIAALELANARINVASLYTFGAPRTGNRAFARDLEIALGGRIYRVANDQDLVTRIPFTMLQFDHAGRLIYFNRLGELIEDFDEVWTYLSAITRSLEGEFKGYVRETVDDHMMAHYLANLARWAFPR